MARFNITIPDSIAKKLDEDSGNQEIPRSTLIAQYIEQHYEGKSEADIDAEIARLRTESADIVQRVRIEHEKKVQHLIATHEAELQQVRADYEKKVEQINADNAATTQQLEEDVERLEAILEKYKTDLTSSEERNASAVERLRQSAASKNIVVNGLQHENELLQQKVSYLETLLQNERGLTSELRHDKESIQKQLELVSCACLHLRWVSGLGCPVVAERRKNKCHHLTDYYANVQK
jgi:chromosome segregation ATPase